MPWRFLGQATPGVPCGGGWPVDDFEHPTVRRLRRPSRSWVSTESRRVLLATLRARRETAFLAGHTEMFRLLDARIRALTEKGRHEEKR